MPQTHQAEAALHTYSRPTRLEKLRYALDQQEIGRRAEALAKKARLDKQAEELQTAITQKLTEERANLQAAKAMKDPEGKKRIAAIAEQQAALEAALEDLATQKAQAEALIDREDILEEATLVAKRNQLAKQAKILEDKIDSTLKGLKATV
ncbi:hypothetical protein WJX72_000143 [[Myrmecia] bisecta]|uniref:Uncharacterized protein n=1 Tax=[Myrmecia] bisecta TaxID=41462 RepID=A0AAW1PKZ6_9CHLO